jgi:hypothetical protein
VAGFDALAMAANLTFLLHDDADAFVPARAASLARLRTVAADPANLPEA